MNLLSLRCMVDAALEHAATMTMGGNLNAVASNGIVDELIVLRVEVIEATLNNMIAVQIFNQRNNGCLETAGDQPNL